MNLGEFAEEATIIEETATPKRVNHFIEANTQEVTLQHLRNDCITPVFAKDNELTVNHAAFIETVWEAANSYYNGETIGTPDIRVSHVIKGRTPDAIHKPANQLLESDKTIYYERAAFSIDIPTIYETVEGISRSARHPFPLPQDQRSCSRPDPEAQAVRPRHAA